MPERPGHPDAWCIRVRGLVQGVGFRPTVWRLARDCGLRGDVRNDGAGVLIRAIAAPDALERFCARLRADCPPLARIDAIECAPLPAAAAARLAASAGFAILASAPGAVHTGIAPDAATCPACLAEIRDPRDRRHRHPFANCTHCGPRLSIVAGIPYDRARTGMAGFPLCPDCAREYADPADRRFHAQPIACPACGPRAWLIEGDGLPPMPDGMDGTDGDVIARASRRLAAGRILAIKGIGGFHLACDATNAAAVAELRRRKRRFAKPFALMARDLGTIRRYCRVDPEEAALLASPAAPILLLERRAEGDAGDLAPEVAPDQTTLGFMLPYSPLHHLLLADWERPLVMTSGNPGDEPQCIDNDEALARLRGLADDLLLHDRPILNRVDDSVIRRMAGAPRLLRRARGHAPAPLPLPPGLESAPPILALGSELKNTFCLTRDGEAILSQHLGDLEEAATARAYLRTLDLYRDLFQHRPAALAADMHPDYRATRLGRERAAREGLPLILAQHHHAHIASTLAEQGWPLTAGPVLGVALDGLGYGNDGTFWGGEWLVADYRDFRRVGHLQPVALPGGARAIREPWRLLHAQLDRALGWERVRARHRGLPVIARLEARPLHLLEAMRARGLNAPLASSAGRLFDAVAAALDLGDTVTYEGQTAIALETLATGARDPIGADGGYPFALRAEETGQVLDPAPLWEPLLDDLAAGVPRAWIAARFHAGCAAAVVDLTRRLARAERLGTVALSGGVMQNRLLLEAVVAGLEQAGLRVLLQQRVPPNDGGIALGQAAIASARALAGA